MDRRSFLRATAGVFGALGFIPLVDRLDETTSIAVPIVRQPVKRPRYRFAAEMAAPVVFLPESVELEQNSLITRYALSAPIDRERILMRNGEPVPGHFDLEVTRVVERLELDLNLARERRLWRLLEAEAQGWGEGQPRLPDDRDQPVAMPRCPQGGRVLVFMRPLTAYRFEGNRANAVVVDACEMTPNGVDYLIGERPVAVAVGQAPEIIIDYFEPDIKTVVINYGVDDGTGIPIHGTANHFRVAQPGTKDGVLRYRVGNRVFVECWEHLMLAPSVSRA